MIPADDWPTEADIEQLVRISAAVRILLCQGEGAQERIKGFSERHYWLDARVDRHSWTWTPGSVDNEVVYHVPHHLAILFKLTWGGK